jgi:hypothetical protein
LEAKDICTNMDIHLDCRTAWVPIIAEENENENGSTNE